MPYEPDLDTEGDLPRTAHPVLQQAAFDLRDSPFSLVVADERARVVDRVDANAVLASKLDSLHLARGYRWSESGVGTNAIGRAVEREASVVMRGRDHDADALADLACAATPITDPRCGRPIGVLAVACRDEAATELMLAYVRSLGRDIERGLLNDGSAAERVLLAHFVRMRRHARGAMVAVNERTMITNAAAAPLINEADHSTLWAWVRHATMRGETADGEICLSTGTTVALRCEPVESAAVTVGALVHLEAPAPAPASAASGHQSHDEYAGRRAMGWRSLSPAQLGIAELVGAGLTNREVAARLYLSRHTVDFHLREIYSKLGIDSRVTLAGIVTEHHVDQQGSSSGERMGRSSVGVGASDAS